MVGLRCCAAQISGRRGSTALPTLHRANGRSMSDKGRLTYPPLTLLIRSRFGQNARVNQAGPASQRARLKLTVRGAVQGVGFRPFVFRLATELGLAGWVNNSPQGVFIEVEGPRAELEKFLLRLETEKPRAVSSKVSKLRGSTRRLQRYLKSAPAKPAATKPRWCCRTSPPARIACAKSSIPKPPPPLSVHQLHQLRPALQHHRIPALRPREHLDEGVHDVPAMPG
jgi:acylphosphatase